MILLDPSATFAGAAAKDAAEDQQGQKAPPLARDTEIGVLHVGSRLFRTG